MKTQEKARDQHVSELIELKKYLEGKQQKPFAGQGKLSELLPDETRHLIQELLARQIDLEKQNKELLKKQMELEGSRNKYFDLYEFAPVGYFSISVKGMILTANHTGADLLGMERSALNGVPFTQFITGDTRKVFSFHHDKLTQTGMKQSAELKLKKIDNTCFYARLESIPVIDENDNFIQFRTAVIDITEQKKFEEALRESENRFKVAGKAAYDLIYEWDIQSDTLEWFGDINKLLGYREGEISGDINSWLKIIHPDDVGQLENAVEVHRTSAQSINYTYRVKTKDGKWRYWDDHALPLVKDEKCPHKWIGVCTDITDIKLAEDILIKVNDDLENRVKKRTIELEEANIALKVLLKKRDEDKTEIEQNMLHNVKELVMPYLDKLKMSRLHEKQQSDLAILESNLDEITSPFVHKLSARYTKLTPTEMQVANFIKHGKTSKEIAQVLCMSKKTIDIHRYNIRKKIGLQNKKINLRMYLSSYQ